MDWPDQGPGRPRPFVGAACASISAMTLVVNAPPSSARPPLSPESPRSVHPARCPRQDWAPVAWLGGSSDGCADRLRHNPGTGRASARPVPAPALQVRTVNPVRLASSPTRSNIVSTPVSLDDAHAAASRCVRVKPRVDDPQGLERIRPRIAMYRQPQAMKPTTTPPTIPSSRFKEKLNGCSAQ